MLQKETSDSHIRTMLLVTVWPCLRQCEGSTSCKHTPELEALAKYLYISILYIFIYLDTAEPHMHGNIEYNKYSK